MSGQRDHTSEWAERDHTQVSGRREGGKVTNLETVILTLKGIFKFHFLYWSPFTNCDTWVESLLIVVSLILV